MSESQSKPPKRSRLIRLMLGLIVVAMSGLAAAILLVLVPQDLSDLEGYGEQYPAEARDLGRVLEESVKRGHEVTLSEAEINRWLGQQVRISQKGLLSSWSGPMRLGVRFEPGVAEVIMERKVLGKSLTFSMFLQLANQAGDRQVVLHGGPYLDALSGLNRGGRFGRLVVPQGYLHLVKSAFFGVGEACSKELHLAFEEMEAQRIEDGRLILVPPKAGIHDP